MERTKRFFAWRVFFFLFLVLTLMSLAPSGKGDYQPQATLSLWKPVPSEPSESQGPPTEPIASQAGAYRAAVTKFLRMRSGLFGQAVGGTVLLSLLSFILLVRTMR